MKLMEWFEAALKGGIPMVQLGWLVYVLGASTVILSKKKKLQISWMGFGGIRIYNGI